MLARRAVARGASEGGLPSRSSPPRMPAFALLASARQPSLASRAKIGCPSSLLTELRRTRFATELIRPAAPRVARQGEAWCGEAFVSKRDDLSTRLSDSR